MDIQISAIKSRQQLRGLLLNTHVSKNKSDPENRRGSTLTKREVEVLQLIVDGKSNRQIASQLALSPNTVSVHRANIMAAFGIHKTAQLVVYAIREGLVGIG
jgi:DNA-binding NarL/FixJ family response regulator